MLDSEALVWGGLKSTAAFLYNGTFISYPSSLYNASARPGFDIRPITNNWCSNPKNLTPLAGGIFYASTSAALASSLQQVSVLVESGQETLSYALAVFPIVSGY